jgi:hypothetical protein
LKIRIAVIPGNFQEVIVGNDFTVLSAINYVKDHVKMFPSSFPIDLKKRLDEGSYVIRVNNINCNGKIRFLGENDLVTIILNADGKVDYTPPYTPGTRYGLIKRLFLKLF